MSRRAEYRAVLGQLGRAEWAGFLRKNSGLPGPRANLELAQAVADEGDAPTFDALIETGEEYLLFCGVVGLGRLLAEKSAPAKSLVGRLREHAADERWRVREAVAMAMQRVGDKDWPRCHAIAAEWAADENPLVQRAAIATVCEPPLLKTPAAASQAIELCRKVTASLVARPAAERGSEQVRALRKALGYGWSVAVAADPKTGLAAFKALEAQKDADVAWIVRENSKKARLAGLLR